MAEATAATPAADTAATAPDASGAARPTVTPETLTPEISRYEHAAELTVESTSPVDLFFPAKLFDDRAEPPPPHRLTLDLAATMSPWQAYPTIDAVHATAKAVHDAHPDLTELRIHHREDGEPIVELVVYPWAGDHVRRHIAANAPDAPRQVLVIWGLHANEPVGNLSAAALMRLLTDPDCDLRTLGVVWRILGCADPDHMRLNTWIDKPRTTWSLNGQDFRPALDQQPGPAMPLEWTAPDGTIFTFTEDRMRSTAKVLKNVLDTLPPNAVVFELHSFDTPGSYVASSRPLPKGVQATILLSARGLELDVIHGDTPDGIAPHPGAFPGFYETPTTLNLLANNPDRPFAPGQRIPHHRGETIAGYLSARGILDVLPDVGTFSGLDSDRHPTGPTDTLFQAALRRTVTEYRESAAWMRHILAAADPHLTPSAPHREALISHLKGYDAIAHKMSAQADTVDPTRMATAGELNALDRLLNYYVRSRWGGALLRLLRDGADNPALAALEAQARPVIDDWDAKANALVGRRLPEAYAAAMQLTTIVAVLDDLRHPAARSPGG